VKATQHRLFTAVHGGAPKSAARLLDLTIQQEHMVM